MTGARLRSVGAGLLAAGLLVAVATTAAAAPAPGAGQLSEVQVIKPGVSAIMTAQTAGGVKIDPASVKATLAGVAAPVSVLPIDQERRVATLLIDTSGSMGAKGMQIVVRAADAFLAAVPKDVYVGVVAFSTAPRAIATPTRDRAKVRAAIAALTSQGETSLYDGVATALSQLGTSGDRSLVLISDGGDTRSRHTLAQTLAALSRSGVRTQVVGFRTDESQVSVLRTMATAGRGSVAVATSGAALSTAFVSAAFTVAAQTFGSQIRVLVTAPPSSGGRQSLVVTATAGGKAFQGIAAVNLSAQSAPSPSASVAPSASPGSAGQLPAKGVSVGPLGMSWLLWLALLTVFLGLAVVVGTLAMPARVSRRKSRLEFLEGYVSGTGDTTVDERTTVTTISASLVNLGDKVMDSRKSTPKTERLLERADLPFRVGEWAVLRVLASVVGVAGGIVLLRGGWALTLLGACLGGLVGFLAPSLFLKFAAWRRARKFESQLPDVLTLVASSLSTGFSLLQALDAVARDAAEPSAKEFSRALAETRIGADLNDSLEHLADRMQSTNLRWTAMAISIQRQVGGNLGETLRNTAATLRDRESLSRHVKALSAEGKLSAYILIALPVGVFLFMMMANRAYIELLWTTPMGIGMLAGALMSLSMGVFWMNKVVKVEI